MNIQIKTIVSFFIGMIMLVGIGISGYNISLNLTNKASLVTHTHNVKTLIEATLSLIKDTEIGQRGYLITDDLSYLEPYKNSKTELTASISRLKTLTADNSDQQKHIVNIEKLIKKKLTELHDTLELYRIGNRTGALNIILSHKGKILMDDIRTIFNNMIKTEDNLLQVRKKEYENAIKVGTITIISISLLSFAILTLLIFFTGHSIHQYIYERDKTTLELENSIIKLEHSLNEVNSLRGIISICSYCNNIRNDDGVYERLEAYISTHSDAKFSHGICPKCLKKEKAKLKKMKKSPS